MHIFQSEFYVENNFQYVFKISSKPNGEYPPQPPLVPCGKKGKEREFLSFSQQWNPECDKILEFEEKGVAM